jgi:hypothetical protein
MDMSEGILLGHQISCAGIAVDADKVAVIIALGVPSNLWELRGFLGFVGYYKRFPSQLYLKRTPLTFGMRQGRRLLSS